MANFNTHMTVAAVAGAVFASVALGTGLAQTPEGLALLALLVTIGGILPDIDLDYAIPTRLLFMALGAIMALIVMVNYSTRYSLVELWIAMLVTYWLIRYPVWQFFSRYTVHRGIFHSLLAALFFLFLTTSIAYSVFDASRIYAWMTGLAVLIGYLVHLALDEIYSIDFAGRRIKRSFGTALKIYSTNDYQSSAIMAVLAGLMFMMTPELRPFLHELLSAATWQQLLHNLWPRDQWFGL